MFQRFRASTLPQHLYRRAMSSIDKQQPTLAQVVDTLNAFAPLRLAESWDNVGLLIEPACPRAIRTVLLTNDLTEQVMQEALDAHTDLIVSYHPPIFKPLTRITQSNWKERIVSKCLAHQIALYSPHTAWDAVHGGVNDWLAKFLDAEQSRPCVPHASSTGDDGQHQTGAGRLLQLRTGTELGQIIERFKQHINIGKFNVAIGAGRTLKSQVHSVAVCAGSGASVLRGVSADLYITGEMSHHDVLDAVHRNISVIACNHTNSERGFLAEFSGVLGKLLEGRVEIVVAKSDADPLVVY